MIKTAAFGSFSKNFGSDNWLLLLPKIEKFVRFIFTLFLFASIHTYGQQREFGWIVGTWQEEGKNTYEVWKEDNGFLAAESFKMKDGNKVVTEEIKLIKKGNDFYYVPDVAGPQGPIEFK